jgi:hypothetical protein
MVVLAFCVAAKKKIRRSRQNSQMKETLLCEIRAICGSKLR